ncbi:hypothetical protein [Candidatus Methylomirabilis sp.]|uniref:hypothetical protein n=1 Tax=Candidatus Methylomirabilis sp. TaxID=2032687 RepID=UPI002A64AEDD|nr:hypothetical protein [Candidatus Methylomirabilis sp.]
MTQQVLVLISFLIVSGALVLVFQMVFFSTKKTNDIAPARVNRYRGLWFLMLGIILGVVFFFTLPRSPYLLFVQERPEKIIVVTAQQFAFTLSDESLDREKTSAEASGGTVLPAGALVEFRVTSRDVNHGFGIYDPEHTIIAQVQAMPGYVNRLRIRFEKPGTYNVLCLEYCGIAHFIMRTSFEVR